MTWPPHPSAPSLVEILRQRAARQGGKVAYRFLADGEEEVASLTFAELDRRARAVGAFLQESGAAGERALLLYPPGLEFVVSFLGCLYGGVIAVPAYPPRVHRASRPDARLAAIVKDARPRFALTTPALAELAPGFAAQMPGLREVRWVATEELDADAAERWTPEADLAAVAGRTAFLQYTSGSTATPKGVMVTHGNLVHNERMIQLAFGQSEDSVIAGWLPLYHDMGLIGNVLQPLFAGASCVLMAPVAFLQQPVRWLRAISRYRATTSGGPNFAYELCARKIEPAALEGLALSSWQVAFNGAEPVRAETLRRFSEVFAPYGFRSEAFYPCYGLAEATLFVTGGRPGQAVTVREVDAEALGRNEAMPATPGRPSRELVSCGGAWLEQDVLIVDPESGETLSEGRVGEVQVGGESVAAGYWERPDQTRETFGSGLLRTGDLGFLAGGELYVTGRVKDLVIVRGRNHYPQDIELTAERSHPALRPGGGAAFSVEVEGEERLVIIHEVERIWRRDLDGVIEAVRRTVAEEHEVPVHAVTLIKPNTLPKTSSGKVRRRSCREDFLAGRLDPLDAWQAGEVRRGEAGEAVAAGVAPRTPTEERLALIWCEVFEVAAAGVEDGFFEMGGDSLKATQMVSRINEAFGAGLPLDSLFSTPTIAGLAALLDGMAAPPVAEAPPLHAVPRETPEAPEAGAPLSFAQRRLWFLHQLEPENPVHNIAAFLRLTGRLDVAALRRSMDLIVERHEALRTVFRGDGSEPSQLVAPPSPVALPVIDLAALTALPKAPREAEEGRIAAAVARLPFALDRGPFVRAALTVSAPRDHGLVLAWHHIAADGWSLGVFVRELTALYQAAPLPDLPVQYADFAVWQRQWLRGEALEARLAFWRQVLHGPPPVLELPTDKPRPPVLSHRGAHHEQLLPERLTRPLAALAREAGATPFMALLSGFVVLLHRSTGQQDLVLGTPISGRNRRELEDLIGVFINNLVLRIDIGGAGGDPSFRQLLQRVRATALAAYAHQDLPFETLVDALHTERDLSRTPLFQILFVEQSAPLRRLELPDLTLEPREIDLGTARFDLALAMAPVEAGFLSTWKYSTDLFDAPTPVRMAGQLENLLAAAVADPDRPLSRLTWLSDAERHQVVLGWNDTREEYRDGVCLHELIEEQVERTPGAVAVSFDGLDTTYRELNRRANRLAHHLRRLGVGPECLVGVVAERSTEMVTGLVATLKAGGAYVPLDPGYPRDRVQFMLEDAGIGVLLTQSHLEAGLPPHGAQVVLLDAESSWESSRVSNPEVGTHPESPAYAIYTSGSTGRPKGAMVPHRGIVNRLLWMQDAYGLGPDDRVLQKTPFSFDVSVWEFFWPLITGARLVMAPPGAHQDAAWLARIIHDEKITTLHFVPSMLQLFLEGKDLATACRTVRRVMASGEALPYELQERTLERIGSNGAELHNLYGPTEASVDVSFHACEPGSARRTVPIGRPISNITLPILDRHDRHGEPVPPGIPGELHIGGVGLARGYLHRPALTAERFVPNPLGGPGERLYRTGDLARFRPDGAIEFLGRIDHQIKIRGVRVELGEIEAALVQHPGVREAVVMARNEGAAGAGETRLVAYLVASAEPAPTLGELRSFLRDSLPEAMVPAAFVVLPAFPLTPSGKVDRRALPAPDFDGTARETTPFAEPRTPLEERLAGLWRELLRVERVGIHDSFFELGGDSIQGAMFINRLQEELGQIVYVMALFDAPTVAGFAAYLEQSYPEAAVRLGGRAAGDPTEEGGPVETAAALEALHGAVVRRLGRQPEEPAAAPRGLPKNPRAVFVLAPFRSGTTLFRVMLAGHPRLFAPPELELLAFGTLGERQRAYAGRNSFALEGLLRAVMELRGCDAGEARAWVAGFADRDLPVQSFYGLLQEEGGGRLLVDKTPSYPLDLETLRRAEEMFEEPLYLHLVRHPRATADSYVEAHMDRVYDFPFPADEQAELVWLLSHRNIVDFLSAVPAERVHRLRFEDLVKAPGESIEAVCAFLGLPFEPAMLDPYQGRRMTDGLHSESRMMGDPKFHRHRGIEAKVADRHQESAHRGLRAETVELAALLGYPMEEPKPATEALGPRPVPRDEGTEMALSYSQERLWFLAQLDPGSPAYNMPATVHLEGILDIPSLARSFGEVRRRHEVLRTTFPSAGDRPVLRVTETAGALPVIDLSSLPDGSRQEMERLALEEGRRPFDLARGPMLRTTLLRLGSAEHALLVTMHHIASDGWTIGILIRELVALYGAFTQGQPSPLPELPLQYADYAVWQRRWLDGTAMTAHLDYWRRRLAGRLPALEMPTDRPRPAYQTLNGARLSRTLSAEASQELREWSRRQGTTPFLTLLAGFNALLHRYTTQDDLLLGIPIANRNRLEVEGLIGFFLNMVVQRTDVSGDPALRELLGRVSEGFLGSVPHQEVPFEKIVEALQPERDLSRAPIFQVQFSLQNTPSAALELPGLKLELLEITNRTTKFDFTVFLFDNPDGLKTTLEYNTDLFDAATIARLLGHWETLLAGVAANAANAERRLSELPVLTAAERGQLTGEWSGPAAKPGTFPGQTCLHRLFEQQARRDPKAVAVVYEVEELSYGRLNERANRLARRLRALGVGPDVPVALCAERSIDMIVGLLGILKAGGAYVPLDPAYPPDRLTYVLEDALSGSCAPVLVTQERLAGLFGELAFPVVRLDADRAVLAAESGEDLEEADGLRGPWPESLAYVIYTSGSTGRPKGVPVTHANAARLLEATEFWFGFGPDEVWTMFHSFAFDFSVWEIWGALAYGGRLVIVPRETTLSPASFHELLATEGVTVLNQTPSAFRQLAQLDQAEAHRGLALRWVIFGGEALELSALAPWFARHGDEAPRLVNMYGITETTVHVTYRPIGQRDLASPGHSPVGAPIPDLSVHLLGPRGELVPVGVPGEIHVGGAGVARGYLGRPTLTAERFVPDPFSGPGGPGGHPGARLYRSGDLARRRPDGDLEYLGRIDHQVKIRGFRIELGEIEAALARHAGVRACVVMARPGAGGAGGAGGADRRLVAWVVPREAPVAAAELREHLLRTLPEYMVPAVFVDLDKLPLTANGKVDRRALPDPDEAAAARAVVAPRNRTEARLAGIWRELLRRDEVGVDDNFFELGGHSLLVTQLASRIRTVFGAELPVRAIFEAPSLASLAARLGDVVPEEEAASEPPIPRLPREGAEEGFPLSFAQERLWFLDQLNPGSAAYNIWIALRLEGSLDVPVLHAALDEVVRRHESLRTRFVPVGGAPRQVIAPAVSLPLPVVDLRALPEEAREAEAPRWLKAVAARPFDLARGPLLRMLLIRTGATDWRAVFELHHIVSDGWSNDVLVREVGALYAAFSAGKPSPLPELPIHYADFAAWQRESLSGEAVAAQMAYWRERLASAPPLLELPTDRPRPTVQRGHGGDLRRVFAAERVREVATLCRGEGATLFMGLAAGFETLLSRYTGRADILTGTPVSGRNRLEVEGLIGIFINSLVLRTDLGGDPSFREVVARTRDVTLGAFAHQDLPYEKLVEELAPERTLGHAPIFQVMLALQNPQGGVVSLPGLDLTPMHLEEATTKLDLLLNAQETDGHLQIRWIYDRDLFDAPTIARMSEHLERLLHAAAADPERRISELPLLTPAEERQLAAWNVTAAAAAEPCLHELVAARVARTPDRVAVTLGDEGLTYGALDAAAGHLAHRLIGLGAGPGVPVGIFAERSLEMIVALLAVLQAGAAYLPIDPDYPAERVASMLADSGLPVLLAQDHLLDRLPVHGARVLRLTGAAVPSKELEPALPASGVTPAVTPSEVAYVIYTSGSTGRPKGVQVTHANAVRLFTATDPWFEFGEDDVWTLFHSYAFDFSVWEIWGALAFGGRLVVVPKETTLSPAAFHDLLASEEITILNQTPSAFRQLVAAGEERQSPRLALRRVVFGGEALELAALTPWWERHGEEMPRLINMYGITETTVHVTYRPVGRADLAHPGNAPIGGPIPDLSVHLLGRHGERVPVGVAGEIHVGGAGVARGYLNRPELTAERFVPDPFAGQTGARLYRSGDLARRRPDGDLEYLGRIDQQVKIRGFRIELGEIETALARYPGVREAVVMARAESGGDRRLVAYLVTSTPPPATPAITDLHAFLKGRLPAYMVPADFVVLDAMPLTSSGKVDRRALPAPESAETLRRQYVAPETPTEELLVEVWEELLGRTRIGIHDNFFELGGHSLLAPQVVARVESTFQMHLPLRAFFEAPTIHGLANQIELILLQEIEALSDEEAEMQMAGAT